MDRIIIVMAVLLTAIAAWPAQAQQQPGPPGAPSPAPAGQQDMRRDARAPMPPPLPPNGRSVPNRMTPEERRQLRRDVNQVGHDIYHDRPARSRR